MSVMQVAAHPAVVPDAIEEAITLRYRRVAEQIHRVHEAHARLATLEQHGHAELARSSRRFVARMESVLVQAQGDYRLAVQRRAGERAGQDRRALTMRRVTAD